KDALASYEKSLQLRLAASGDAVDSADEGRAVLRSHLKLADVKMNAGKTDDAAKHIETALDLARRFGTTADRGAVARREGELALRRGDLVKAEQAYLVALQTVRQESDPTTRVSVAGRLGYIYKLASRQQEAMQAFDVALAGAMQLHAAAPDRPSHVRQIMNIHNDRADALRSPFAAEGIRLQDALREYEAALDNAVWLAKADPSAYSARLGVLFAKAQIADTWRELEPARAIPLLESLFAEVAVLRREDPSNFQTQWFEALLRSAWADATRASGAQRQALARYDEAVTRIGTMQQTDRGRSISKRDLTKVLADRGALRLTLGDVAGASADAVACRPFADGFTIAKARPLDLRDAASCYELGGDVAMRNRRSEDALHDYDAALERWREFEHRKLTSPFLREHRASAERRRAEAATSAAR
ncbi:MAG: hypothetical protein JOZ54_19855, partial [Acidobacteria bacterium]|nr:hypothetical protein [Acidobacteriota bacterium]